MNKSINKLIKKYAHPKVSYTSRDGARFIQNLTILEVIYAFTVGNKWQCFVSQPCVVT